MKKIEFMLNVYCIISALTELPNMIGAVLALICAIETPVFIIATVICSFNTYCIHMFISSKTDKLIKQKLDLAFEDR